MIYVVNDGTDNTDNTDDGSAYNYDRDQISPYQHGLLKNAWVLHGYPSLSDAGNEEPRGLWLDNATMHVVDRADNHVYAYKVSSDCWWCQGTSARQQALEFDLDDANAAAEGIWGNADTVWVANDGTGATDKIYAYNRTNGSRDSGSDFDTLQDAGNKDPRGLWSDGTTMWVLDNDRHLYAYNMDTKQRDTDKEIWVGDISSSFFGDKPGSNFPDAYYGGIWFDGLRLLVLVHPEGFENDAKSGVRLPPRRRVVALTGTRPGDRLLDSIDLDPSRSSTGPSRSC